MPELVERIRAELVSARRNTDKDRTVLLGTVLAALQNREIELGRDLTDADVVEVLRRQIKQRLDSVEQYTAGGRADLAAREGEEVTALRAFLPPEADVAEILAVAREAVAAGTRELGPLMAILMGRFRGKADGKVINQAARDALQQG